MGHFMRGAVYHYVLTKHPRNYSKPSQTNESPASLSGLITVAEADEEDDVLLCLRFFLTGCVTLPLLLLCQQKNTQSHYINHSKLYTYICKKFLKWPK